MIAHELGHYSSGDVALGPWIFKTRAAIGRTLEGLGDGFLSEIFGAYGRLFLRITQAVSRQQEFIADAVAARLSGVAASVSALRQSHALAVAHSSYWQEEVALIVQAGYLPRLAQGFTEYLSARRIEEMYRAAVAQAEGESETGELDTHPALAERIRSLEKSSWRDPILAAETSQAKAACSRLFGDIRPDRARASSVPVPRLRRLSRTVPLTRRPAEETYNDFLWCLTRSSG